MRRPIFFIPTSNESTDCASAVRWRLPRGLNTLRLAAGCLTGGGKIAAGIITAFSAVVVFFAVMGLETWAAGYTDCEGNAVDSNYTGWVTDGRENVYWLDSGVMAADKEVYDPQTDAWYWFDADGTLAVDKDVYIPVNGDRTEGKWVRYDKNGHMIKGADIQDGKAYYFDEITGAMQHGEYYSADKYWHYYDTVTGIMKENGFAFIPVSEDTRTEGKWCYYDADGHMCYGIREVAENWYYFDKITGAMQKGDVDCGDGWYYYDEITGIRMGEAQYAKGGYLPVYEYLQTVRPVSNRGLPMEKGENGYFQMYAEDNDSDFNVVQFTDIHLKGEDMYTSGDIAALDAIYTLARRTKPDFIVFTGDIIFGETGYNVNDGKRALNVICTMMDKIGIPWTWTFGNHDHDFFDRFSSGEIAQMLRQSKMLRIYEDIPAVYGYTNGVYELYHADGTMAMAVITMDSGDTIENPGTYGVSFSYDYIHNDEVQWYENQIKRMNKENGTEVQSLLYFHIPLQEWDIASRQGKFIFGAKREEVCDSAVHSSLFDKAVKLGSTQAMFCGHDHVNDYSVFYKGIQLVYGKSIDYICYPGIAQKTEQRGATEVFIHADGSYTIAPIKLKQ